MDQAIFGFFKLIGQLFVGLCVIPFRLVMGLAFTVRGAGETKQSKVEMDENARMAGCRDIVTSYAQHLGYIARECISRDELEKLIDEGISPEDLEREIQGRIEQEPGIILGVHSGGGYTIKLPYSYRSRHAYIIGRSGSGKTNEIRNMLMQDINNGCGVGVIAPEAELLTDEILPYIPQDRMDDVVYFDPADTQYPIPINPLHLDEAGNIDLCVDDNLTIFKRLMGDDTSPRMDEIWRQTCYALLERKGSTLLDVEKLLIRSDSTFREEIIQTTTDEQTRYFFEKTYPAFPKDAHLSITTRIGRLVRPKMVRTMLCQEGRSFNFREAMDDGKILLFNLSDGLLGEQTSQLLGQLIISKIQMAVMSRADTPRAARFPFHLYLDEFQTFCGVAETSYEKILSRARKYNLSLTLAHQQTSQISTELLAEILGNVSTLLVFTVSHADASKLSKEFLVNLGNESMHLPDDFLQSLKTGEAFGKIGSTVFPLRTWLADQNPDPIRVKEVIERSRINYGGKVDRKKSVRTAIEAMRVDQPSTDEIDPAQVY